MRVQWKAVKFAVAQHPLPLISIKDTRGAIPEPIYL